MITTGWEKRFDMHGRSYYIDHIERKTTWTKPAPNTSVVPVTPVAKGEPTITRPRPVRSASISVEDRHQLESRLYTLYIFSIYMYTILILLYIYIPNYFSFLTVIYSLYM